MTFSTSRPPQEATRDEFPVLDQVVNVNNCFYYLSLLERFVQETQDMSPDMLKLYLVRAEYRYYNWVNATSKKYTLMAQAIPPLDVAFFWQAHMLSPLRFYEDNNRHAQFLPYKHLRIPLKEIHEASMYEPKASIALWKEVMPDEPYHLKRAHLLSSGFAGYAEIKCIVCMIKMQIEWSKHAEWRTDHTVALQCHRCRAMFTVKHVGKDNFIFDLTTSNAVAGLMLSTDGKKDGVSYKDLALLGKGYDIKSLPFNQGLEPLNYYILKNQLSKMKNSENSDIRRKRIIDAVQSTYLCNPYKGSSIDLIQAVARQYKFAVQVTQISNWDLPQGIVRGIREYSNFLHLIKVNPTLTAVPTFEIDLAWHTHMLHPSSYRNFTIKHIGKFLNHDDTISEDKLEEYIQETHDAWEMLGSKPREDHAMHNSETPLPKKSNSSKLKFKNPFKNEKVASVNVGLNQGDTVFKGSYSTGLYETTPAYNPIGKDENIQHYNVENISFHDKRDIPEFIFLNNSDELMDGKFQTAKDSKFGFIGTSTCASTEYLNRWPRTKTTDYYRDAYKSDPNQVTYSKVFVSTGTKPSVHSKILARLPYDQRKQHEVAGTTGTKVMPNSTEPESFDWNKIYNIWESSYGPIPSPKRDWRASCGGGGIFTTCGTSNCSADTDSGAGSSNCNP